MPPTPIVPSVPSTPSPYLYVPSITQTNVTQYAIDPATGLLTLVTSVTTHVEPEQLAMHPSGKLAFAACMTAGFIDVLALDPATGSPSVTSSTAAAGVSMCACHPSGKYLYAASIVGPITGYSIDPGTGALTALPGSPYTALTGSWVSFDPTGKFAFVALSNGEAATATVTATGDLTLLASQPAASGYSGTPTAGTFIPKGTLDCIACDPTGVYAYGLTPVIGAGSEITLFTIDPNQGLVFAGTSNIATTGQSATALAIDPAGRFVFNVDEAQPWDIHSFSVAATGGLTAVSAISTGDPNATLPGPRGQGTISLALDRTGRFAYCTNIGNFTDSAISCFQVDAAGNLTFTGTTMCAGAWNLAASR
jgi:6-phosphogluconolactonase (cycloisomerase 2 family)